jgi:hypothetical protein
MWLIEGRLLYNYHTVKVILRPTVSRPVRPGVRHPSGTRDQFFPFSLWSFLDCCGFVGVGRPLWREDGSVICSAMTQVECQVILRPTVCRPIRPDFNFFVLQLLLSQRFIPFLIYRVILLFLQSQGIFFSLHVLHMGWCNVCVNSSSPCFKALLGLHLRQVSLGTFCILSLIFPCLSLPRFTLGLKTSVRNSASLIFLLFSVKFLN